MKQKNIQFGRHRQARKDEAMSLPRKLRIRCGVCGTRQAKCLTPTGPICRICSARRRQTYLLSYFYENHLAGRGISSLHAPPSSTFYGKNPGGLGMANIRGLQRTGTVHEPTNGLFYLTPAGILECEAIFHKELRRTPHRQAKQDE